MLRNITLTQGLGLGPDSLEGPTQRMFMSGEQNAGQNHNLMIANKTLKNVAKFRILEEIKSK
jgi:hypothetical protein